MQIKQNFMGAMGNELVDFDLCDYNLPRVMIRPKKMCCQNYKTVSIHSKSHIEVSQSHFEYDLNVRYFETFVSHITFKLQKTYY